MNMVKKTLTEDYLYATCDNTSFSKEEIDFFTMLVDTRTVLKEDCADVDDQINKMINVNEMAFTVYKIIFIRAAEEILYRQHADLPLEKDLKKIPKRRVYDFFNLMNMGLLEIEAEWFSTLNNKQKQDLLNELLKRLTEDILHRSTKLNLCENTKLLCYYSSQQ